ncbi:hypothetical protein JAAARDRAFT_331311 [Jaapia argillacea MUCL 33604]|uniref:Uncharacterized protein n=1 Tax=Jaapia argillacea MUCL 33604 TaxID=933084 RepID=A0A067PX38_9AGAM|nr:hypothetical protein JAAARDRAFT_331311 [Jaapia argillacea MUCL 33604]
MLPTSLPLPPLSIEVTSSSATAPTSSSTPISYGNFKFTTIGQPPALLNRFTEFDPELTYPSPSSGSEQGEDTLPTNSTPLSRKSLLQALTDMETLVGNQLALSSNGSPSNLAMGDSNISTRRSGSLSSPTAQDQPRFRERNRHARGSSKGDDTSSLPHPPNSRTPHVSPPPISPAGVGLTSTVRDPTEPMNSTTPQDPDTVMTDGAFGFPIAPQSIPPINRPPTPTMPHPEVRTRIDRTLQTVLSPFYEQTRLLEEERRKISLRLETGQRDLCAAVDVAIQALELLRGHARQVDATRDELTRTLDSPMIPMALHEETLKVVVDVSLQEFQRQFEEARKAQLEAEKAEKLAEEMRQAQAAAEAGAEALRLQEDQRNAQEEAEKRRAEEEARERRRAEKKRESEQAAARAEAEKVKEDDERRRQEFEAKKREIDAISKKNRDDQARLVKQRLDKEKAEAEMKTSKLGASASTIALPANDLGPSVSLTPNIPSIQPSSTHRPLPPHPQVVGSLNNSSTSGASTSHRIGQHAIFVPAQTTAGRMVDTNMPFSSTQLASEKRGPDGSKPRIDPVMTSAISGPLQTSSHSSTISPPLPTASQPQCQTRTPSGAVKRPMGADPDPPQIQANSSNQATSSRQTKRQRVAPDVSKIKQESPPLQPGLPIEPCVSTGDPTSRRQQARPPLSALKIPTPSPPVGGQAQHDEFGRQIAEGYLPSNPSSVAAPSLPSARPSPVHSSGSGPSKFASGDESHSDQQRTSVGSSLARTPPRLPVDLDYREPRHQYSPESRAPTPPGPPDRLSPSPRVITPTRHFERRMDTRPSQRSVDYYSPSPPSHTLTGERRESDPRCLNRGTDTFRPDYRGEDDRYASPSRRSPSPDRRRHRPVARTPSPLLQSSSSLYRGRSMSPPYRDRPLSLQSRNWMSTDDYSASQSVDRHDDSYRSSLSGRLPDSSQQSYDPYSSSSGLQAGTQYHDRYPSYPRSRDSWEAPSETQYSSYEEKRYNSPTPARPPARSQASRDRPPPTSRNFADPSIQESERVSLLTRITDPPQSNQRPNHPHPRGRGRGRGGGKNFRHSDMKAPPLYDRIAP